jgi:hypothetical protein
MAAAARFAAAPGGAARQRDARSLLPRGPDHGPRPGGRRSPGPAWSGIPRPRSRRRDSGYGVPSAATTTSRKSNSSPQRTVGCQRTRQCQRCSRSQGTRLRSTAPARGRCCTRVGKHASATKGTRRSDVVRSGRVADRESGARTGPKSSARSAALCPRRSRRRRPDPRPASGGEGVGCDSLLDTHFCLREQGRWPRSVPPR